MKNRFLRVFANEAVDRPPFWFMRQAGRYLPEYQEVRRQAGDFMALCFNSDLATKVTLQPIDRFNMDAAILFADILLICEAMGQKVSFAEGIGPQLQPTVASSTLAQLTTETIETHLAPVFDTVSQVRRELPAEKALIGFAGAPWTVATYMVEGGTSKSHALTKRFAFSDTDGFQQLIDLLVDGTTRYLIQQVRAGADALQIFDSWAGALPAEYLARWSVAPIQAIAEGVKREYPNVPILVFPRAVGASVQAYAKIAAIDGISLDSNIPLEWAVTKMGSDVVLQGNLDPELLVVGGAALRHSAQHILAATHQSRFIFNLGHGIVPETPPQNVAELALLLQAQSEVSS